MNLSVARTPAISLLALSTLALATPMAFAGEDVHQFNFANVGSSYTAAIFSGSTLAGRRVTSTRIELNVFVDAGSDAAEFSTDILLPIDVDDEGGSSVVAYTGSALNWTGVGAFTFTETTNRYNGVIIPARYGAETFGVQGNLLEGSGIFVTLEPLSCAADLDDGTGTGTPDDAVTIDDLLFFLGAFEQGSTDADLDDGTGTGTPDDAVTVDDLLYFLVRFEAGC
jgi:hypothetical protein